LKRNITESDIVHACIILAVLGLGVIHISQSFIQTDRVEIGSIDRTWIGNSVSINGSISSVYSTNETVFLSVEDSSGSITVVDFDGANYSTGSDIETTDYVKVCQNKLDIITDEIKLK